MPDGEAVMHLERVLLADGQRIGLESTYLPRHRFGRFSETFDPTTSLYAAIRATGSSSDPPSNASRPCWRPRGRRRLLESTTAMPMLRLHRRSLDTEDRPIEVVRSLYRGDRVAFEAVLTDRD